MMLARIYLVSPDLDPEEDAGPGMGHDYEGVYWCQDRIHESDVEYVRADGLTEAYAEGRSDQFADDCAVVRLLLENCDDADAESDGRMNTTRIRELLSHFDALPRIAGQEKKE
jgi:hypothetical protein